MSSIYDDMGDALLDSGKLVELAQKIENEVALYAVMFDRVGVAGEQVDEMADILMEAIESAQERLTSLTETVEHICSMRADAQELFNDI